MSATPVPVVSPPELPVAQTRVCMNCGAPLAGEYCAVCGQRHEPHVHTLGHFLGEAFEGLTHADSRLWRTLGYLLVKPGRLTREFLDGRRARYLPPFRLYLVVSLLFFVIAGLPEGMKTDSNAPPTRESVAKLDEATRSLESQLGDAPGAAQAVAAMREEARRQRAQLEGQTDSHAGSVELDRDRVQLGFCDAFKNPGPKGDSGYAMMQGFCKKASHMSGQALVESLVHNIPRAMFVFLPLLAAIMKLLYWRPKRYYVEHLLFLVHNHAFVFLALSIATLFDRLTPDGNLFGFVVAFLWLYMFWYIFRAMRVFYAQSRWLTFAKYLTIGFAYVATSALVLGLTAIYSALTL